MLNIFPKKGTVRYGISSDQYLAQKFNISNLEGVFGICEFFCMMMRKP